MAAKGFLLIIGVSIMLTLAIWFYAGSDSIGQQELVDDWRIFGCNGMGFEEVDEAIENSECAGYELKETSVCNENTNTLWIDLDIEKEGCAPACVVHTDTGEAEINWRCTGLISE